MIFRYVININFNFMLRKKMCTFVLFTLHLHRNQKKIIIQFKTTCFCFYKSFTRIPLFSVAFLHLHIFSYHFYFYYRPSRFMILFTSSYEYFLVMFRKSCSRQILLGVFFWLGYDGWMSMVELCCLELILT